jgi:hypothetical protein
MEKWSACWAQYVWPRQQFGAEIVDPVIHGVAARSGSASGIHG